MWQTARRIWRGARQWHREAQKHRDWQPARYPMSGLVTDIQGRELRRNDHPLIEGRWNGSGWDYRVADLSADAEIADRFIA